MGKLFVTPELFKLISKQEKNWFKSASAVMEPQFKQIVEQVKALSGVTAIYANHGGENSPYPGNMFFSFVVTKKGAKQLLNWYNLVLEELPEQLLKDSFLERISLIMSSAVQPVRLELPEGMKSVPTITLDINYSPSEYSEIIRALETATTKLITEPQTIGEEQQ